MLCPDYALLKSASLYSDAEMCMRHTCWVKNARCQSCKTYAAVQVLGQHDLGCGRIAAVSARAAAQVQIRDGLLLRQLDEGLVWGVLHPKGAGLDL